MEDDYAERARVFGMAMTRLTEDDLAPWLALHRDEQDEFSGEKSPERLHRSMAALLALERPGWQERLARFRAATARHFDGS